MPQQSPISAPAPSTSPAQRALPEQSEITQEIRQRQGELNAQTQTGQSSRRTALDFAPYRSSLLRHPTKNPQPADPEAIELLSPAFGQRDVHSVESDLTAHHNGEPQGERITVSGTLRDSRGHALPHQLVEVWQANAGGPYVDQRDRHPGPLDPNFTGMWRAITNAQGEYTFTT